MDVMDWKWMYQKGFLSRKGKTAFIDLLLTLEDVEKKGEN